MHGKCDLCVAISTHTVPISIDGSKPKTLDLCDLHRGKLLGPVEAAIAQYGANPKKKPKKGQATWTRASWMRKIGPFKCRVEGCIAPVLKDGEVFNRHLQNLHDMTFRDYVKVHGSAPATQEEIDEPVTIECEVVGCDSGPDDGPMVYSTLFGNRWPHHAMSSHMRGRHGLVWKPSTGVIGKVAP